jgi:multidrug efflux pump subunit AcrA (membrane-fusion protein)
VFSCNTNREFTTAQKRSIIESVYASVVIQPDSLYEAYSIVSGILDQNLVEEGGLVKRNQNIIEIINNTPKLNAENSKLAYDLAVKNYKGSSAILNSIKDEIAAAELQCQNDSINYFRQANLWKQNIGSKTQYDSQKLKYQLSKNTLNLLKSKLTQTENELRTAVEQTQNTYKSTLSTSKDFTIKSNMDGKVYALYKEPGEIVSTREPLASIGSASNFIIEMLVDEVDIVKITLGQKVVIHLDAYGEKVFEAEASKIYPKKDKRNQTFLVEAVFNNPPNKLYPGLSGEANIIIAKNENALTIPKSFLVNNNQVLTDNGLISVELGLENMEYVEIVSGLDESTTIYNKTE